MRSSGAGLATGLFLGKSRVLLERELFRARGRAASVEDPAAVTGLRLEPKRVAAAPSRRRNCGEIQFLALSERFEPPRAHSIWAAEGLARWASGSRIKSPDKSSCEFARRFSQRCFGTRFLKSGLALLPADFTNRLHTIQHTRCFPARRSHFPILKTILVKTWHWHFFAISIFKLGS